MKRPTKYFSILIGVFAFPFSANASLPDLDDGAALDTQNLAERASDVELVKSNIFVDGCDLLKYLENKVELTDDDLSEGLLLEEIIGNVCDSPLDNIVQSSNSHRIQ